MLLHAVLRTVLQYVVYPAMGVALYCWCMIGYGATCYGALEIIVTLLLLLLHKLAVIVLSQHWAYPNGIVYIKTNFSTMVSILRNHISLI